MGRVGYAAALAGAAAPVRASPEAAQVASLLDNHLPSSSVPSMTTRQRPALS